MAEKNRFVESIEYLCFRAVMALAQALSFRAAGGVGAMLGGLMYSLVRYRREVTRENLAHAFPELNEKQRRTIARAAYRNYGRVLIETLWSGAQPPDVLFKTVAMVNPEAIMHHLSNPSGLILLVGHYGNWEFMNSALRHHLGRPISAIAQRLRNRRIDVLISQTRTRWHNTVIPMGVSSRGAFEALRNGRLLLMAGDQSGPKESIFVEFFGRPAATHRGPSALSLKTGAPIVMVFPVRRGDGVYEVFFEQIPTNDLKGTGEENVEELTRRHVAVLERYIRMHPDHWLWMHKRWKHTDHYLSRRTALEET